MRLVMLFDVLQPGREVPFEELSEMINTATMDDFNGGVKRLPNSEVLHVYKVLQGALLNKSAGTLDRPKCIQFLTALVKLKFDYLQNVPSLKQELSTMQTVIEQRSRIVKDSHRVLGRLQLILNKNSSPSGSSANDLDSSYSTSSDGEGEDELEDIDFDDDDDEDNDDDIDDDDDEMEVDNDDEDDDEEETEKGGKKVPNGDFYDSDDDDDDDD